MSEAKSKKTNGYKGQIEIYYWSKLTSDDKLAGGDIRAKYVIPEMMKISNEISYLLFPEDILDKKFLGNHQSLSKILLSFLVPVKVAKLLKKSGGSIRYFYCSTCYSWDIFPAILVKLFFHTKLICISHDTPKQLSGYSFYRENEIFSVPKSAIFTLIGKFQIFLLKYVEIPVSVSKFAMDFFTDQNVRKRAILSSNTIPSILMGSEKNSRPYDLVILGRIIPRKNINYVIKSLKDRKYQRKIELLVITNSPESSVETEIMRDLDNNLINLTVKYNATEKEKFNLLKQSKIYVNLSKDENFSVAAMEAASMGVALIVSNHDFFSNIYCDAAIYVNENNTEDVWAQISNLLNDSERINEYSERSLSIASKYLAHSVARKDYKSIENIITGGKENNEL